MPSVKKNLSWNILLTVSGYIFPLITFPYITRVLGAESLGLANYVISIVSYAILFSSLGIVAIGIRYISHCIDKEEREKVFSQLVTLHLVLTSIVIVIYTLCVLFIPRLYEYKELYFVGIIQIVMNVFLVEWFFQGMQDFKFVTIRTLAIRSLYVISIFILVRSTKDFNVYFFITVAQVLVNAVVNWKYSHRFVSFRIDFKGCKKFMYPVFSMGINLILLSFYGTFNIIFLGSKCDAAAVGYYVAATRLYAVFLSLLTAYNNVLVPYLNTLSAKGEVEKFKQYVKLSFSVVIMFSIPLIVGGIVLAPEVVRFIAGPGYERSILPFQIILIQVFLVGCAQVLENQILLSYQKFREILISTTISTALSVIIIVVFVPRYAEVASSCAVAIPHLLEFALLLYYSKKTIEFNFPVRELLKNIVACIPIMLFCYLVRGLHFNTVLTLLVAGFISAGYYFIIQLYVFKNTLVRSQVERLLVRVKQQ